MERREFPYAIQPCRYRIRYTRPFDLIGNQNAGFQSTTCVYVRPTHGSLQHSIRLLHLFYVKYRNALLLVGLSGSMERRSGGASESNGGKQRRRRMWCAHALVLYRWKGLNLDWSKTTNVFIMKDVSTDAWTVSVKVQKPRNEYHDCHFRKTVNKMAITRWYASLLFRLE